MVFRRFAKIPTSGKVAVFSWSHLGRFAVIAVPSILQQSFISIGNIIIQSVINSFGAAVMAGYSAAVKLNNMVITCLLYTSAVHDKKALLTSMWKITRPAISRPPSRASSGVWRRYSAAHRAVSYTHLVSVS